MMPLVTSRSSARSAYPQDRTARPTTNQPQTTATTAATATAAASHGEASDASTAAATPSGTPQATSRSRRSVTSFGETRTHGASGSVKGVKGSAEPGPDVNGRLRCE